MTTWVIKAKEKFLGKIKNINKNTIEKESVTEDMDLSNAKKCWIKETQNNFKQTKNFENIKKQLYLFVDLNGLWRWGGRTQNSNLSYSVIHPYFIPREHYFTKLAVLKSHENVKHNGVRDTINNLREEFWISKSRNYVQQQQSEYSNAIEGLSNQYRSVAKEPPVKQKSFWQDL